MQNKKQIKEEKKTLTDIKSLIMTYQEIAAIRMQKVRTSVLKNREYVNELRVIYSKILANYRIHNTTYTDKKALIPKHVVLLLSSNTGLYGNLVQSVLKDYLSYVKEKECDLAVVGSVGQAFVRYNFPTRDFEYFALGDGVLESPKIDEICNYIFKYETITIFFGKFYSVLNQSPDKLDLDLNIKPVELNKKDTVNFIFEPTIEDVMSFFKNEILSTMVEQTVSESGLSKFASRMISLDSAVSGITARIKNIMLKEFLVKHSLQNKKQSNMFSSFSLWKQ